MKNIPALTSQKVIKALKRAGFTEDIQKEELLCLFIREKQSKSRFYNLSLRKMQD